MSKLIDKLIALQGKRYASNMLDLKIHDLIDILRDEFSKEEESKEEESKEHLNRVCLSALKTVKEKLKKTWMLWNGSTESHPEYFLSVKRLSDDEIFNIGDYVEADNGMKGTITKFEPSEDKNDIFIHTTWSGIGYSINGWKKVELLITTEDGVEIFDKQTILYALNNRTWFCGSLNASLYKDFKTWLLFSTKEARDEYIFKHKPLLSLDELERLSKACPKVGLDIVGIAAILVKEKLNIQ